MRSPLITNDIHNSGNLGFKFTNTDAIYRQDDSGLGRVPEFSIKTSGTHFVSIVIELRPIMITWMI